MYQKRKDNCNLPFLLESTPLYQSVPISPIYVNLSKKVTVVTSKYIFVPERNYL